MSHSSSSSNSKSKPFKPRPAISEAEARARIRSGDLHDGVLRKCMEQGFAFVTTRTERRDVKVQKLNTQNALEGERVAVRLLPAKKDRDGNDFSNRLADVDFVFRPEDVFLTGKLVPKKEEDGAPTKTFVFHPTSSNFPRTPDFTKLKMTPEQIELNAPTGVWKGRVKKNQTNNVIFIEEYLGDKDSARTIEAISRIENRVPVDYPKVNDAEIQQLKQKMAEEAERRPFVNCTTLTIDPPTAKDLDDALSINCLPGGGFEVGVHIADLDFFVPKGSPLDLEAKKRGVTFYFPTHNTPMIPREISENLCSLLPHQKRLAVSVIWKISAEGDILSTWYGRTAIETRQRLSYAQAQNMITPEIPSDLPALDPRDEVTEQAVKDLMKVSKFLHEHRAKAGIVEFNNDELYFQFDDQQNVTGIVPYPSYEANDMIEEFMLFAGMSVASNILHDVDPNETAVLLRVNPAPDPDDLKKLKFLMDLTGRSIDGTSQRDMLSLFKAVEAKYSDNVLKKKAALRMIQRISRRATYEALPSNFDEFNHYGIHAAYYTHFTSPIRRYPDLVVHRILTAKLQGLPSPYTVEEICDFVHHLNRRLSDSSNAEKDSEFRIIESYVGSKPFFTDAVVVSINRDKIFLFLDGLFQQVNANINEFIGSSEWKPVEFNSAITSPALAEPLRLMDTVRVQVHVIAHTLVPVLVPSLNED